MNTSTSQISSLLSEIADHLNSEIIGQKDLIQNLIITIFAGGHALLEGPPWLGKTRTIRALSQVFSLENKRISFTPDLLPSDLIGSEIYRANTGNFELRKGPIFTNILLADEINRTPPKVQSALLEAMEEKQVTIGTTTLQLPHPFFVFATQNPIENEGTYPLPEAQLDRFFMKILIHYPSPSDEKQILLQQNSASTIQKLHADDILQVQKIIQSSVQVDEKIVDYVVRILDFYRRLVDHDALFDGEAALLQYGPSPRAGISLIKWVKVRALMMGREYVLPEDIKALVPHIINHRVGLSYYAQSEQIHIQDITNKVLDTVTIL